jgi:hypothetical protein
LKFGVEAPRPYIRLAEALNAAGRRGLSAYDLASALVRDKAITFVGSDQRTNLG